MDWINIILIIFGLGVFETVSSIDNAIVNAEVLATMRPKARRWFLIWGLLIAVFAIRGLLPWAIIWFINPAIGPVQALLAAFSSDPSIKASIEASAPILLVGGGVFLLFLFFHWLFLENKNLGLPRTEKFFMRQGAWFYAIVSIILSVTVWCALKISDAMAFGAVVGSTVFFITHGFKQNAEMNEQKLLRGSGLTDISKIFYLEAIDATFSIDGVLGAFAFTLSVPLILLGNGLGAIVVRQLTISNIDRIKKYAFLKNGAMYSIFFLGMIMLLDAFGFYIPQWLSPLATAGVVAYFFVKSKNHNKKQPNAAMPSPI